MARAECGRRPRGVHLAVTDQLIGSWVAGATSHRSTPPHRRRSHSRGAMKWVTGVLGCGCALVVTALVAATGTRVSQERCGGLNRSLRTWCYQEPASRLATPVAPRPT
jgi:hypothetical protein